MQQWPGNPVASMEVIQSPFSTSIQPSSSKTQFNVLGGTIQFSVPLTFNNNAVVSDQAFFSGTLYKMSSGTWVQQDLQSVILDAAPASVKTGMLVLSVNMVEYKEQYAIYLKCGTTLKQDILTPSPLLLQATQISANLGNFKLSFVPVSIVYCPPGQDMTNSLTQTKSFGTRFSMGFTSDLGWASNMAPNLYSPEYVNNSQISTTITEDDIEISQTSNTTITADNQKAIGRAYWGPLGDLFVIAANLNFSVIGKVPTKRIPRARAAPGSFVANPSVEFGPNLDGGEQILIIPAWKLLRPGNDPIASLIPEDVRKTILQLDPFITNLDQFFPDSGVDLALAANPFIDPSANNRASLIGRWWLDTGVEVNYALGNSYQQSFVSADELSISYAQNSFIQPTGDSNSQSTYLNGILTGKLNTDVTYQQSSETDQSVISNAACFLIKNQNDYDLDGIAVYFDKIFSTFMFQRLKAGVLWTPTGQELIPPGFGVISGSVVNWQGIPLQGVQVIATDANGKRHQTSADLNGNYSFYNLTPGSYALQTGDQMNTIVVQRTSSPIKPVVFHVKGVRRIIALHSAPVWEVAKVFDIPKSIVRKKRPQWAAAKKYQDLLSILNKSKSFYDTLQKEVLLVFGKKSGISGSKRKSISISSRKGR